MINGNCRRSLLDVKRDADVDSDHHLVLAALKLRLRNKTEKAPKRFEQSEGQQS